MEINYVIIAIIIGAVMDSLIGDPYSMPHPIRLFGNSIAWFERVLNRGSHLIIKGGVMWIVLISLTYAIFWGIATLLADYVWALVAFNALFFYYGISNRCLIDEGLRVERKLQNDTLEAARVQVGMIVGRDTSNLTPTQIRKAVVETLAENLSDGVVAPLFFFAIGGVPLMMTYKMINTLDSMVGYKNDRYIRFGTVAARMDDVANYIPSRLTALYMLLTNPSMRVLRFIFKYGSAHSSPNAGYPESAAAGILDCRLGGPSYYFGKVVEKPYIGEHSRDLTHLDVVRICWVNGKVAALCYLKLILTSMLLCR